MVHIVGVLNITPDSISGDGLWGPGHDWAAVIQSMWEAGADSVDIGAEATSPLARSIDEMEEKARLKGVFEAAEGLENFLWCDTRRVGVAREAYRAGFQGINDVSGGRGDVGMLPFIAESGLFYVMMYAKNAMGIADRDVFQGDVLKQIHHFFDEQINKAYRVGILPSQLILDPGMGDFISGNPEDSLRLIAHLPELKKRYQLPLYVGVSRKRFLSYLSPYARVAKERAGASLAMGQRVVQQGADYFRVHDVRLTRQFFDASLCLVCHEP